MSKSKHFKGKTSPPIPSQDIKELPHAMPFSEYSNLPINEQKTTCLQEIIIKEQWLITHESKSVQRPPHTEVWEGTIQEFLKQYITCYITYAVRL